MTKVLEVFHSSQQQFCDAFSGGIGKDAYNNQLAPIHSYTCNMWNLIKGTYPQVTVLYMYVYIVQGIVHV